MKWQMSQEKQLAELKEQEHYRIIVKFDERKGQTVTIECTLCSKKYSLSNVGDQIKVSNWTKHVKKSCLSKPTKEAKVDDYFLPRATSIKQSHSFQLAPPMREGHMKQQSSPLRK